ncbi:MAG: hypothetical protein R3229_11575 [Alphaproteobacteria bacterium]|nr:hypothetical protein [Alphaproteobacteria bacterium]
MPRSTTFAVIFAACCAFAAGPAMADGDDHDPHMKLYGYDGTVYDGHDDDDEMERKVRRKRQQMPPERGTVHPGDGPGSDRPPGSAGGARQSR